MPKRLLALFILIIFHTSAIAQASSDTIAGYKASYASAKNDTVRLIAAANLAYGYRFSNVDSSNYYNDLARTIVDKNDFGNVVKADLLSMKGAIVLEEGKLPEALLYSFEALNLAEKGGYKSIIAITLNRIGNVYMELEDYRKALDYYQQSAKFYDKGTDLLYYNELSNIGHIYERLGMADSALYYLNIVIPADNSPVKNRNDITYPELMFRLGNAYKLAGDTLQSLKYYKLGITESNFDNDTRSLVMNQLLLAQLYYDMNVKDSSYRYAKEAVRAGNTISFRKGVYEASTLLSQLYRERNKWDSAFLYLNIAATNKDSLVGLTRFRKLQSIILEEQERLRQEEIVRSDKENRLQQLILAGGGLVLLIVAFLQYRNIRQKQKANKVLQKTLGDLKATQVQLLRAEKMASLGELTAGIAHEIQNPLNFVNNFSEVNTELITELEAAAEAGKLEDVKQIAQDLKANENKISHHGKRADSIVKGMLQHSQKGSGEKELTDINAMADEYLRLAYHGLRAKDNTMNAGMETHLDDKMGMIPVVQQDISRVLLNLYNNAFYSVGERFKQEGSSFKPLVSLTTSKSKGHIIISVADNGLGIPEKIKQKIFQPFFTTKPTGEGTGLGLSLSYDIIKAHGGEITLNTEEGSGTTFIITLPINQS